MSYEHLTTLLHYGALAIIALAAGGFGSYLSGEEDTLRRRYDDARQH
jgi:hypothetical protein